MAAPPPFTGSELAFLGALVDEGVEFLVVGLAAAALQGAPAVTQGIDLWFRDLSDPQLHRVLRKVGTTYVPPSMQSPPLLVGGGAELFDIVTHMHGLESFSEEVGRVVKLRIGEITIPVLPLDRIIASKRATNRPKDRAILPALEDTLAVLRSRRSGGEDQE